MIHAGNWPKEKSRIVSNLENGNAEFLHNAAWPKSNEVIFLLHCNNLSFWNRYVSEIYISKNRFKEVDSPITRDELKQMRSVLGCLAWHADQIAIELSAPVGLPVSKCTEATVADLIETKLLKTSKSRQHQTMTIHALDPKDIVMATWVDAGHANRPDLSSTKGIFIGCTSMKILQGSLEAVNPFFLDSIKDIKSLQVKCISRNTCGSGRRGSNVCNEISAEWILEVFTQIFGTLTQLFYKLKEYSFQTARTSTTAWTPPSWHYQVPRKEVTLRHFAWRVIFNLYCNVSLRWVNGESQLANSLTKFDEPQQVLIFNNRNGNWRFFWWWSYFGKTKTSNGIRPPWNKNMNLAWEDKKVPIKELGPVQIFQSSTCSSPISGDILDRAPLSEP